MDKIVLISGAYRGIGLAMVQNFLDENFSVIGTSINCIIDEINSNKLTVIPLDVTTEISKKEVYTF